MLDREDENWKSIVHQNQNENPDVIMEDISLIKMAKNNFAKEFEYL